MKKVMLLLIATFLLLSGCSLKTAEPVVQVPEEELPYVDRLEDGVYYIRHKDYNCDKLYLGYTTFDYGETVENPNNNRVAWFQTDWENIPTMYYGDTLVMRTEAVLSETFHFERLEDMGYSFGIRGLKPTVSGRYAVPTDDTDISFPGGDTDVVLEFENKSVIIEAIGGVKLRNNLSEDEQSVSSLSRCGTVSGLIGLMQYAIEIYSGTEEHDFWWTADKRILCSMETWVSHDYEFSERTIMEIAFPENARTGYYMLDGVGIFRYISEADTILYGDVDFSVYTADSLDFNLPNSFEQYNLKSVNEKKQDPVVVPYSEIISSSMSTTLDEETGELVETVDITVEGTFLVEVTSTVKDMLIPDGAAAIVVCPSGQVFTMNKTDGCLSATVPNAATGKYKIGVSGLNGTPVQMNFYRPYES